MDTFSISRECIPRVLERAILRSICYTTAVRSCAGTRLACERDPAFIRSRSIYALSSDCIIFIKTHLYKSRISNAMIRNSFAIIFVKKIRQQTTRIACFIRKYKYWLIARSLIDENHCRKQKQLYEWCIRERDAVWQFASADDRQTLKLNTLAINPAFTRLSGRVEGSRGRARRSSESRGNVNAGRGWKLYTRTYISVASRGRGMSCSHGDTLTHRTDRWCRKKKTVCREENPSKDSSQLDLLFRVRDARDAGPVIRATTLAMSHNLGRATSRYGGVAPFFSCFPLCPQPSPFPKQPYKNIRFRETWGGETSLYTRGVCIFFFW